MALKLFVKLQVPPLTIVRDMRFQKNRYIHYYNKGRIKQKLADMSSVQYQTYTSRLAL